MSVRRATIPAMIDLQDYSRKLDAKVAEAEEQAEHAYRAFRTVDAHPMSTDYKAHQQMAVLAGGILLGLVSARAELTDDTEAVEKCGDKIMSWLRG